MPSLTPAELKRRLDSGKKQQRRVQVKIKAQLKRECIVYGCHESLAFKRTDIIKCDKHKSISLARIHIATIRGMAKRKSKAQVKKENRVKKQHYYDKHGIKFDKTIRKRTAVVESRMEVNGRAAPYTGQALIYQNYKEPLKPIEKAKGYGYYGTLAMSDDKEFVQCHICGNLYANLSMHLRKHKIKGKRYKEIYQLSAGTRLISETERERMQRQTVKKGYSQLPDHLKEYNYKVQQGLIKHNGNKGKDNDGRGTWTLEKRNKEGRCPEQVLEKIRELADKLGRVPSYEEFVKHYKYNYIGSIRFQWGSYSNAVHQLGMQTMDDLRHPDKERLLRDLQDFQKQHGRIPMTSDFNRGLLRDRGVYIRLFGSLNNARLEAGMNAVVPMPFGQIIELTPEEYEEYKTRHIPRSKRRANKRKEKLDASML